MSEINRVHYNQADHSLQAMGEKGKKPPEVRAEVPKTPLYDTKAKLTFKATKEGSQPKVAAAIKVPLIAASIIPPNL